MTGDSVGAWLARARGEEIGKQQVFKTLGEFGEFSGHPSIRCGTEGRSRMVRAS